MDAGVSGAPIFVPEAFFGWLWQTSPVAVSLEEAGVASTPGEGSSSAALPSVEDARVGGGDGNSAGSAERLERAVLECARSEAFLFLVRGGVVIILVSSPASGRD